MGNPSLDELKTVFNGLENSDVSHQFGEKIDVYSCDGRMFALVNRGNDPFVLSVLCDHRLSRILQDKYESVMPGQKLDQDKWISIILTGQVPTDEINSLIRLSYNFVK